MFRAVLKIAGIITDSFTDVPNSSGTKTIDKPANVEIDDSNAANVEIDNYYEDVVGNIFEVGNDDELKMKMKFT